MSPTLTATVLATPATSATPTGHGAFPLLMLGPSLGTRAERLWSPVVPLLSDVAYLVTWDLPGHGRSPATTEAFTVGDLADAVVELTEHTTRELGGTTAGAYHAGVSLGGATSLEIGLRHPREFSALAVFCSGAKLGTPQGWRERAELIRREGTGAVVDGSRQRWFAPGFTESRSEVADALLADLLEVDDESYARCCEALAAHDVTDRLGDIVTTTVAVAGEHDQVAPPEMADTIARAAPNARSVTLPGVAHLAPTEAPLATARVLRELIARAGASDPLEARKEDR
ncbi:alpha/beta fold hydrolase [Mobilicoccus massiliensis]|uniref:alpha/beta fold hydrolase n=1 Tax=Mobilicoccus massiliensis TaxID=1522310 RepID=UPI0009E60F57|nr:alpha/beta fold hydrolase [Mobilicoccus massiliensis]